MSSNDFNPFNPSLPIPQLLLLEQSGELTPEQASTLAAWRQTTGEPATLLADTVANLTRPLPDPGVPLHPLRRDHILKAARSAHLERRRAESGAQKQNGSDAAGKVLIPAWETADNDETPFGRWTWLGSVAALAAVFLFGLYVVNRPGPDGGPETAREVPAVIQDPLEKEVPAPMFANAEAAIEAFLDEPYTDFSSQLSELDQALFESQVDFTDESDWLVQLD